MNFLVTVFIQHRRFWTHLLDEIISDYFEDELAQFDHNNARSIYLTTTH